jgi:hypothetical protein
MSWDRVDVSGQHTEVKQVGQRIEQLDNFGPGGTKDHIVSNDGLNANYVRINGQVVVDDKLQNPYGS